MSRRIVQEKKVNIETEDVDRAKQSGYCLNISQLNKDGKPKKAPLSGAKNRWSNPANEDFIFIEEPLYVAGHRTDVEEYLNRYPEDKGSYLELAFTKENTGESGVRSEEFGVIVKRQKEALKMIKKDDNKGKTERQKKMDEKIALLDISSDIVKDITNTGYKIVTKSQTEIPVEKKKSKHNQQKDGKMKDLGEQYNHLLKE